MTPEPLVPTAVGHHALAARVRDRPAGAPTTRDRSFRARPRDRGPRGRRHRRRRDSDLAPGPGPDRRPRSAPTASSAATSSSTRASRSATGSRSRTRALVYHGVTVGDGVFIGPGAILTNDRYPRAITSTGELADGRRLGGQPDRASRDGCSIGAGAVVVAGVRRRPVRDGRRRRGRHPRRPEPRPRRRQPGAPDRLGLRLRRRACSTRTAIRRRPRPGATPPTPSSICGGCGRTLRLHPGRRDPRGAARPAPGSHRMIPIARPDIGPEEIAAVTEVLDSGMLAQGRRVAELEDALGGVRRRQARDRDGQRHARPDVRSSPGIGLGAGRRGHHRLPHVRRDRERDPVHRRDAGLRRHRARHLPHRRRSGSRPRSRRGRGRSARSTCSGSSPTWT